MAIDTLWINTHKALNDFNKILTCKECKEKLSNPQQFLNCGHYFCGSCVKKNTTCLYCKIPGEASDIYSDRTLKSLLFNLNIIAEAVGLPVEQKNENLDLNLSEIKTVHNNSNKNITSTHKQKIHKVPRNKTNDEFASNSISESVATESNTSRNTLKKNPTKLPKHINKKNRKGETALHIACRSNNLDRIKILLHAGAHPNTKDNANWTPLQEAASYDYYEVCEILLEAGALPDLNGYDNKTALHEAVINNDVELVSLLLSYNANKNVFDNLGKRPKDYCKLKSISKLLESSQDLTKIDTETYSEKNVSVDLNKSSNEVSCFSKIVLYGSNLNKKNRKLLAQLALKKKLKVANNLSPSVSHVIFEADESSSIKLSFDVLLTIIYGKWILRSDCLIILIDGESITANDLNLFEINPPELINGPVYARENEEKQKPKLFNNCYFYFAMKSYTPIQYADISITKESLIKLVSAGDGITLTREPKPEDCQGLLSPFHVAHNPKHSLHKCTHYIIYIIDDSDVNSTQSNSNRIIYNMPTLKSLPLKWFIESILRFKLIDPIELGL